MARDAEQRAAEIRASLPRGGGVCAANGRVCDSIEFHLQSRDALGAMSGFGLAVGAFGIGMMSYYATRLPPEAPQVGSIDVRLAPSFRIPVGPSTGLAVGLNVMGSF